MSMSAASLSVPPSAEPARTARALASSVERTPASQSLAERMCWSTAAANDNPRRLVVLAPPASPAPCEPAPSGRAVAATLGTTGAGIVAAALSLGLASALTETLGPALTLPLACVAGATLCCLGERAAVALYDRRRR
jgi:hypothetical protein